MATATTSEKECLALAVALAVLALALRLWSRPYVALANAVISLIISANCIKHLSLQE